MFLVNFSNLFGQSLPRDLPPAIISQGEKFKPVQGQSEWSSDESPEDKFFSEEPRLKRRPNLKAVISHCSLLTLIIIFLLKVLSLAKTSHIKVPGYSLTKTLKGPRSEKRYVL